MEIKTEAGPGYFNRWCKLCGEDHETTMIIAIAYDGDDRIGLVCDGCLGAGSDGIGTRMLSYAAQLIEYAACLQEQANTPIIMNTSLDELHRENDRAEEKMAADRKMAEEATRRPRIPTTAPVEEFSDDIPF